MHRVQVLYFALIKSIAFITTNFTTCYYFSLKPFTASNLFCSIHELSYAVEFIKLNPKYFKNYATLDDTMKYFGFILMNSTVPVRMKGRIADHVCGLIPAMAVLV